MSLRLLLMLLLTLPALAFGQEDEGTDDSQQSGDPEPSDEDDEEAPSPDAEPAAEASATEEATAPAAPPLPTADDDGEAPPSKGGKNRPPLPPTAMEEYLARPDAPKPRVSDFIATQLTFYVGDDNLLAGNADRSPALGMANEYPELFFEGLNAEKVKVVTETHMVLYAKMPGFLKFVDTEASFVAEFELARDPDDSRLVGRFRDDGSWLAATFWFGEKGNSPNLRITAWPFSADRFRLGYTYDLTWAGDRLWARNRSPVPGAKLALDLKVFEAFVGAKSLVQLRADNNEVENYWGVMGGLGPRIQITDDIRLQYDVNGGYFTRGTFQQEPHRSKPVIAFGASHRLLFAINEPTLGRSPDTVLMFNDQEDPVMPWQKLRALTSVPNYRSRFGLGVTVEVSTIGQSLIDAEDPSSALIDDSFTAAFRARVRFLRSMRIGVDVVYRDVSFLVLNVPGLTPYVSFATDTIQKPQAFGALWWDWFIERARLRPGLTVALMQPASFSAREDANGRRQVQVIREANDYELLPAGTEAFSIVSVKASLRWHLSPILAIAGEVAYTQDFNNTRVVTDSSSGVGVRVLDDKASRQLGLNLFMQAAF
jgi:hypothetical protein